VNKVFIIIALWMISLFSVAETEHFIVLQHGDTMILAEEKIEFQNILDKNDIKEIGIDIKEVGNTAVLRIGPFENNNKLALYYMKFKELFPEAVIIEENRAVMTPDPIVSTVEKKVYVTKEVPVEKVDQSLWTALFGLAIVGVLFMFLSSDQIKRLKKEHEKIKLKHTSLEAKQHEVLSSMGENIHTLAKETMGHTSELAEKIKETPLEEEMQKVIYNENELLDVTGDLIKFLRLKSKKVIIQNEVFNFNHVLNEVSGMLNHTHQKSDIEIIFDIDKGVPRYLLADSLHLGQILINLLDYTIQNTEGKEVALEVTSLSSLKEGLQLQLSIDGSLIIEDKETVFETYYDEVSRKYIGLGLFVAHELIYLMNGHIEVIEDKEGYSSFKLTLPIEEKNKEKRKYHLPNKDLVGKKILMVEESTKAAQATQKLFSYFKAEVTRYSMEKFFESMPNFSLYDIVLLNNRVFNPKTIEALNTVKDSKLLKVISLDNLFSSSSSTRSDVIDINLVKPLNQEYVYDTLVELYDVKVTKKVHNDALAGEGLLVYHDVFKDTPNVTLDSFQIFEGAHILIVEDNVINQKVVLSVLAKSKMNLHTANNGEEAIAFMQSTDEKIDFIFMDINMPVMDGYSATEIIRQDTRFDKVPIVALTALVSQHEIDKMFDYGMNGYLSKPVHIEKMFSALKMFVKVDEIEQQTPKEKSEDLVLDGLNIKEGLSQIKGNDVFYREVLREFVDAYEKSDVLFEKLVQEKRYAQIKMLCLDMKGLTGTIGAKELHHLINEIHQHIIYKKPELLHSYVSKYRTELEKLTKAIATYLLA
jgi:two-component system sensor histidine kinase/response regulator